MSRNLERSRLHHESVINDRNLRPLTIAFATIAIVWMLAFGAIFVSAQIGSYRPADGPALAVSTVFDSVGDAGLHRLGQLQLGEFLRIRE